MSMLPELLGGDSTPHAIEFRGKRYTLAPITLGLMEELETAHLELAKKRLKQMADVLPEDAYVKKGLDLYEQYERGEFGFLSATGQAWLKTPAGALTLMRLALSVPEAELVPLILHRGQELKELVQLALREAGLAGDTSETAPRGKEQPGKASFPDRGGNP